MLEKELLKRDLPPILQMDDGRSCTEELWDERKTELLDILQKYLYGYTPKPPKNTIGKVVYQAPPNTLAGKATHQRIDIKFDTPNGEFSFPLNLFLPKNIKAAPLFLHITFSSDFPDRYSPIEEIIDNGFGLALIYYKDIVNDNLHGDYSDGLGKVYIGERKREPHEWGKIGMWAYAGSRAMDYLLTRGDVDHKHIAVAGHSRLGKTALWCAAQDERFFMAISNNSGIEGAAVTKYSTGERISAFLKAGSWDWFCERFKEDSGHENNLPYDQHFLLAAIAPRFIAVGSAELDPGADPKSEFLSSVVASEAYKLLGYKGLISPDKYPTIPTSLHEGKIGYHVREGNHYFSRTDWLKYMSFMKKKIESTNS